MCESYRNHKYGVWLKHKHRMWPKCESLQALSKTVTQRFVTYVRLSVLSSSLWAPNGRIFVKFLYLVCSQSPPPRQFPQITPGPPTPPQIPFHQRTQNQTPNGRSCRASLHKVEVTLLQANRVCSLCIVYIVVHISVSCARHKPQCCCSVLNLRKTAPIGRVPSSKFGSQQPVAWNYIKLTCKDVHCAVHKQ